MRTSNIDDLLEKYWEGETSLQEEQDIKAYFAAGDILPEYAEIAPLFGYFAKESSVNTQKDYTATLQDIPKAKVFNLSMYIRTIAAVFALAICAYVGYQVGQDAKESNHTMAYEIDDPEKALEITKQALAMLSTKLTDQTESVSQDMQRADNANIFK